MSGGYRKYLQNIIPRMLSNHVVQAILCASPESLRVQDWFEQIYNVEFTNCRPYRFLYRGSDSQLRLQLEEFSPDVIFIPLERFFRFKKVPVVNMIQNMEPFVTNSDGNSSSERLRQWVQRVDGRRAIKKADGIIGLSRFVCDFLVTYWGIPNEKISLVYHGIDVTKNEDGCKPDIIPDTWHGEFIFTAGSIRPARGLEDLLQAMRHVTSQGQDLGGVVVAGGTSPRMIGYQKKLKDWIQTHKLSSEVCWVGDLDVNEMAWCYRNCRAFVMTSRVESFGMIGGEAMSHGCISIAADNPPLPEIFKDAAVYYPPKDSKALAKAIQLVVGWNSQKKEKMSERAKSRAAEFSWDVCTEKTVAALADAVRNSKFSGRNVYE